MSQDYEMLAAILNEAAIITAQSFEQMARAFEAMSRVRITDEMTHSLAMAGQTGWMAGYKWRHDWLRLVSYGERIKVRPPRREKRRALKRKWGKR